MMCNRFPESRRCKKKILSGNCSGDSCWGSLKGCQEIKKKVLKNKKLSSSNFFIAPCGIKVPACGQFIHPCHAGGCKKISGCSFLSNSSDVWGVMIHPNKKK